MSNFDKFPEPNTKQLKISAELRFFLEQIKIKQYRKLGEILNDLEKVKKVFRSWRRRSTVASRSKIFDESPYGHLCRKGMKFLAIFLEDRLDPSRWLVLYLDHTNRSPIPARAAEIYREMRAEQKEAHSDRSQYSQAAADRSSRGNISRMFRRRRRKDKCSK